MTIQAILELDEMRALIKGKSRKIDLSSTFKQKKHYMQLPLPKEDKAFIVEVLKNIPYNLREDVMENYVRLWEESFEAEELIQKKKNRARRAANLFLLEFMA